MRVFVALAAYTVEWRFKQPCLVCVHAHAAAAVCMVARTQVTQGRGAFCCLTHLLGLHFYNLHEFIWQRYKRLWLRSSAHDDTHAGSAWHAIHFCDR